jgi:hypothetical protein
MTDDTRQPTWPARLIDGVATTASVYLFFLIALEFRDHLLLLPLLVGAVAAAVAAPGRAVSVARGVLLFPLLAVALGVGVLVSLFVPWGAVVFVLALAAPLAARETEPRRRLRWLLPVALALIPVVIVPLVRQPAALVRFAPLLAMTWISLGLFAAKATAKPRPLAVAVLVLLVGFAPVLAARQLPCNDRELARVLEQPGVEALFTNRGSIDMPEHRSQFLCDATTGIRAATPHSPAKRLGLIDPDGGTRTLVLAGEASIGSAAWQGKLYTGPRGRVVEIDLQTGDRREGPRLMEHNVGYLRLDPESGLIAAGEDKATFCHLARLPSLAGAGHVRIGYPGACLPLGENLLLSEPYWLGRHIWIQRVDDGAVLAENRFFDVGFGEVVVDRARGIAYASSTLTGHVAILDLNTLEITGGFSTRRGVRSVLVDPAGDRVFAWDYFAGVIVEHHLPGGEIGRTWRVGTPLRVIDWDCDGEHLLAATCLGGFRIDVSR